MYIHEEFFETIITIIDTHGTAGKSLVLDALKTTNLTIRYRKGNPGWEELYFKHESYDLLLATVFNKKVTKEKLLEMILGHRLEYVGFLESLNEAISVADAKLKDLVNKYITNPSKEIEECYSV